MSEAVCDDCGILHYPHETCEDVRRELHPETHDSESLR
jgi:hypothetical protein